MSDVENISLSLKRLRNRVENLESENKVLKAKLEKAIEQRNHRVKMTDEFPKLMIDQLNAELDQITEGKTNGL